MQVLLLENVRFHKQEEKNDPEFAKQVRVHLDDSRTSEYDVSHLERAAMYSAVKL